MIKAVLFDFDDTLVKTKEIRYKAIKEAGNKYYGLTITDKDIDRHWGKPFGSFIVGVFQNSADANTLTEKYKLIANKYPNESIPNTNKVLKLLHKTFLLGIISSNNPDLIYSGMNNAGIDSKMFFFIQSSEDTNVHKPEAGVFDPSIRKLRSKGIDKTEILYIGDAIDDCEAAIGAGLHFCALANRTVGEEEFKKRSIPYIRKIKKLPNFISNIR